MNMPLTIRDRIGGNNPPSPINLAQQARTAVSDWMRDHPVIETPEDAREAKACIDRARTALDEMEAERDKLVRPLNAEVAQINERYKPTRASLETITRTLKDRLTAYAKALEAARLQAMEEARAAKAAAEAAARAAEAAEREAYDDAAHGVCADVGMATMEADAAFAEYERAGRVAARAEKDTHVRIAGGYGRAMSLRTKEILCVADYKTAIEIMGGPSERVKEAIIIDAKAYRKIHGELPDGIMSIVERSL